MKRPETAFIPTPQTIRGTALQARPRQQAEVEEVAVADDDHQITMIRMKVQIQMTYREQKTMLTRKGRVKTPSSTSPAHPWGMTGERLTHPGGTKIFHMGKH